MEPHMRILASILFAISLLLAAGDLHAQQGCRNGTQATLTGTIGSIQQAAPVPGVNIWVLKAQGGIAGGCSKVSQIWGDGNAPKNCSAGKKFSATGAVQDAESFWILYSKSVTCQ